MVTIWGFFPLRNKQHFDQHIPALNLHPDYQPLCVVSIITGRPHFIALCYFSLLCFTHVFFFFFLIERLWQPHIGQVCRGRFFQQHLFTSCLCCVLVVLAALQTFFIVIFVVVICDQWSLMFPLKLLKSHTNCWHKTANLLKVCVLTAPRVCCSSPTPPASLFLETQ